MKPIVLHMIRQRVPDRLIVAAFGCSKSYVAFLRKHVCGLKGVERKRK